MSISDILLTIDGAELAERVSDNSISAGTQDNPTGLGTYNTSGVYITALSGNSIATNKQKHPLLSLPTYGTRINMSTFGSNIDYTAYLYEISLKSVFAGQTKYLPHEYVIYLPGTETPTDPPQAFGNYAYEVFTPDIEIQYTFSFSLVNNSDGKTIGYFFWDVFVQKSD